MSHLRNETQSLENAYFAANDQFLIDNLRDLQKLKETKENLAAISGIHDTAVLDKLIQLGVQAETLSTLAIIPLVAVAWADGTIDDKERKAILSSLQTAKFATGIQPGVVEHWLQTKPKPQLLEAWMHYVKALAKELSPQERKAMGDELVGHARQVAEAAGGVLGLGSVSLAEKAVLEKLSSVWG